MRAPHLQAPRRGVPFRAPIQVAEFKAQLGSLSNIGPQVAVESAPALEEPLAGSMVCPPPRGRPPHSLCYLGGEAQHPVVTTRHVGLMKNTGTPL